MLHKVKAGTFADSRRGSRHERGYGSRWDKIRERIKKRASGLCEPCVEIGVVHEGHQCDHRISKAEWKRLHGTLAGVDDDTNLQWMNRDCHAAKTIVDRQRAAGLDVPPWAPAAPATHNTTAASSSKPSGPVAPIRGATGTGGQQAGGGEKSGADLAGTEPPVKFLRAGNPGGGVSPSLKEGVA